MTINILCFGNRARGDDAVGEIVYKWLKHESLQPELNSIPMAVYYDSQLQPEHIFDLKKGNAAVFIDCMIKNGANVSWQQIQPGNRLMFSSHTLPIESLLYLYESTFNETPPPCYLLAVKGSHFELGEPPSQETLAYIEEAKILLLEKLHQLSDTLLT